MNIFVKLIGIGFLITIIGMYGLRFIDSKTADKTPRQVAKYKNIFSIAFCIAVIVIFSALPK